MSSSIQNTPPAAAHALSIDEVKILADQSSRWSQVTQASIAGSMSGAALSTLPTIAVVEELQRVKMTCADGPIKDWIQLLQNAAYCSRIFSDESTRKEEMRINNLSAASATPSAAVTPTAAVATGGKTRKPRMHRNKCHSCGQDGHNAKGCTMKCLYCGQAGHKAKSCPTPATVTPTATTTVIPPAEQAVSSVPTPLDTSLITGQDSASDSDSSSASSSEEEE